MGFLYFDMELSTIFLILKWNFSFISGLFLRYFRVFRDFHGLEMEFLHIKRVKSLLKSRKYAKIQLKYMTERVPF